MASRPTHCDPLKAKENICKKNNLLTDHPLAVLITSMPGGKDKPKVENAQNSPLRQMTLDSSLLRKSSPLTHRTSNVSNLTIEAATAEAPCEPLTEEKLIRDVTITSDSPATKQTTLIVINKQKTTKKQTRPTKPKAEKGRTQSVSSRYRSVDQQFTQSAVSRCPRSETVSVSPRKRVAKDGQANQTTVDTSTLKQTTGKKHQTQLTNYGIRRTARQFAKDLQRERDINIQDCLRNNVEEGMKIIHTEEKGRGIISTRPFYDDEFIVEYAGELISEKEAKRRETEYRKDVSIGSYMFYFVCNGQKYCVDATAETLRLGRLVNHSRLHPNCQVRTVPVDGVPRLALFARRPILPGEELLYDYGDRDKETLEAHPWLKT